MPTADRLWLIVLRWVPLAAAVFGLVKIAEYIPAASEDGRAALAAAARYLAAPIAALFFLLGTTIEFVATTVRPADDTERSKSA